MPILYPFYMSRQSENADNEQQGHFSYKEL